MTETSEAKARINLDSPEFYLNRELSLLQFQHRVYEEAADLANPLLERVKFLSILSSNLDEFFMVRVAGLWQQLETTVNEVSLDGKGLVEQLADIRQQVTILTVEMYKLWRESMVPELEKNGICILEVEQLNPQQRTAIDDYFREIVYPVLTPLAFDNGRPFPHISNLSLNIAVVVTNGDGKERFARVKVPGTLPQLAPVPSSNGQSSYVWLEQVIIANLRLLFQEMEIVNAFIFHITRDAELAIQSLETDDLLEIVQEAVWRRHFRDVVRLQINTIMPQKLVDLLAENLELDQSDIYRVDGPVDLTRIKNLMSLDRPLLKDKPFAPYVMPGLAFIHGSDIFSVIRKGDVLLHHPFESFQSVVDFLRVAAHDPDVLAIKTTLYRVGRNSPITEALLDAIQHGKQVAAMVELKARFDEESNIEWAQRLEREGVHVVYGLPGLKVHAKSILVVRREGDSIRRYVHLGTGNYNPVTAKLYTDLGLFTCDADIGADVSDLFNHLTGYSAKKSYRKLLIAPHAMRTGLENLVRREIEQHKTHGNGRIILKMNALEDQPMMKVLYEASQAGVQIDAIVRGVCALRPGVPGVSDNIRVKSILGRFLEHSRIYYFFNNGEEQVYAGSADFMRRNFDRRVEILFPVESPQLVRRIRDEILEQYLLDEGGSRYMHSDGTYMRPERKQEETRPTAQTWFVRHHA